MEQLGGAQAVQGWHEPRRHRPQLLGNIAHTERQLRGVLFLFKEL